MNHYFVDFSWVLSNNRPIKPFPIKGKLSLWNYDGDIEFIPESECLLPENVAPGSKEDTGEFFKKYWEPLIY